MFTLLLTVCTVVKRKVKISQNFVAFSEYMNFDYDFLLKLSELVYFYRTVNVNDKNHLRGKKV